MFANPYKHIEHRIAQYYMQHPDLLENLLVRMGAQNIAHKYGKGISCTCPLHGGDSPRGFALWYDEEAPIWKCFSGSCGKGGLATMMMKKFQIGTYEESVVSLGRTCGIHVDGNTLHINPQMVEEDTLTILERRLQIKKPSDRQQAINIFPESMNEQAKYNLRGLNLAIAKAACYYLTGSLDQKYLGQRCRQIPPYILDAFGIGLVPANTWVWYDQLKQEKAGWFLDYISFPWRYVDGRLMGFAGRRFDGQDYMKYKTLPGTLRSLTLWGLGEKSCQQMIKSTSTIHLVEGYTDVMRGHQHGCHNIAAVGGTELTVEQLRLLDQLGVNKLVNYFDGDSAGRNASRLIGSRAIKRMQVFEAIAPNKKDPGDLIDGREFWAPIAHASRFVAT